MIATLVAAGCEGMSFKGVAERMTLHDADRLFDVWAKNGPPAYIALAAQAGWKPQEERTEEQRFDDLMRMLSNGDG